MVSGGILREGRGKDNAHLFCLPARESGRRRISALQVHGDRNSESGGNVIVDLNIRDFPEWLAKQLKQECLRNGVTLREYVIARLDFGDKASAALAMDKALELNKRRKDGASGSSGRAEYPEVKDLAPLEKRSTGSKSQ